MTEMSSQMQGETIMPTDSDAVIFKGAGAVRPTGEYELNQIVEAMDRAQKPVEAPEIVCIDECPGLEPQPVRAKTPGGASITGFAAVVLLDGSWSLLKEEQRGQDMSVWYKEVVEQLERAEVPLACHTDNHASGENSSCGAADKLELMIADAAEHGMEDDWVAAAEAVLGDYFNAERWEARVDAAKAVTVRQALRNWKGSMMLDAIASRGGLVEVLNGDQDKARDPDNTRHNHWGEGIRINTVQGSSNDRDKAEIPFFQVDVPAVIESVQPLASSEEEFSDLLHAAVLYTRAVAFRLTDGLPVDIK
jgi:hypothetical protein